MAVLLAVRELCASRKAAGQTYMVALQLSLGPGKEVKSGNGGLIGSAEAQACDPDGGEKEGLEVVKQERVLL